MDKWEVVDNIDDGETTARGKRGKRKRRRKNRKEKRRTTKKRSKECDRETVRERESSVIDSDDAMTMIFLI